MKASVLQYTKKYQRKWVAKNPNSNTVIASNKNLEKLVKKMEEKNTDYVLEKVLPLDTVFIH